MNEKFTWIYGIWFVPSDDNTKDFLGMLGIEDGRWTFNWRFRYYMDAKAHGSNDVKRFYSAAAASDIDEDRERVLVRVKATVAMCEGEFGCDHDFVLLDCKIDDPKIFFELGSRPWANIKMESK